MFVCQICHNDLTDDLCCEACHVSIPTHNGVPQFLQSHEETDAFGLQWNQHAKAQLDSHSGLPISRNRLFCVTGWPRELSGQKILEAGSGAGRFTEILLASGAEVYSFDASHATQANVAQHGAHPRAHIFRASVYDIPFPPESFDRVLCLGVLQHTPDPERAFRSLVRFVKPGGEIVVDVYRKDVAALLQWKYLLRPLTKRLPPFTLYRAVRACVPRLLPLATATRRRFGQIGARLFPIAEYGHLGLRDNLAREWAILDTFDMYAPIYDKPQSLRTVRRWFAEACPLRRAPRAPRSPRR